MSRVRWSATLGLLTGLIGLAVAMVPSVAALEDTVGLRWLFLARGTMPAPKHVAIVSVDEGTAERAGLPPLFRDWSRATHATLVDRLVDRGVSAIAFDVEFFRHGASAEGDQEFASSIARAGRVVLVQRFEVSRAEGRELWARRDPIPSLANAAAGLAPVPVPDAPAVSWFWSFLRTPIMGDAPSLPAVALQVHTMPALGSFLELLQGSGVDGLEGLPGTREEIRNAADLLRVMQVIRREVQAQPSAVSAVLSRLRRNAPEAGTPELRDAMVTLATLYSGPERAYLNFYGPPGGICTVPYDRLVALAADEDAGCSLRDSIVLVGLGPSRLARSDQSDTYHTIYDSADGVDFSGVELHATALANLLTRTTLRMPSPAGYVAAVLLAGVCFGAGGYWVRTRRRRVRGALSARLQAAAVLGGCAALYCGVAYVLFRTGNFIVPLVIPVAIQFPCALVLALLTPPSRYHEQVRAVCLATDAEGSTAVGQQLPHDEYARLLSDYNRALSRPVQVHGGAALEPEGDGFIGVWCSLAAKSGDEIDPACRLDACLAAIEITEAARQFNLGQTDGKQLPARIGLTVGTVTVDSDADHGVFNAIGDAVNIAARLRDLNREVGSQVLASEEVVKGLETKLWLRPVAGTFALKGIAHAPVIFEVERLASRVPHG